MHAWGLGVVAIGLFGCRQDHDVVQVTRTDTWHQAPTNQVDILFVIDDSHSMTEEQAAVAAGFNSFVGALEDSGSDFQIGIITTSFLYDDDTRGVLVGDPPILTNATPDYATEFEDRVQVGIDGSDKEKGLEAAEYATSAVMQAGPNAGFLRPDAYFLTVFVSDEEDCSDNGALEGQPATACYNEEDQLTPVPLFTDYFQGLKDDPSYVQVGAIVGPLADDGGCQESAPGRRYMDFAHSLGGLVGNICDTDYSGIMGDLGLNATGIVTSFQLTEAPDPDTIEVHVADSDGTNDVIVPPDPANGWTFDVDTNYLTFNGTSVPARATVITATYTVKVGGGF